MKDKIARLEKALKPMPKSQLREFGEATLEKDVNIYRKRFSDKCILASSLGTSEFGDFAYYFLDKDTKLSGKVVPGGYPIKNIEIVLLDKKDRQVSRNRIGEISVYSRYGSTGYWGRPDLTSSAFLKARPNIKTCIFKTG